LAATRFETRSTPEGSEAVSSGARSLIDLSHDVEHGMITYKGLPAPMVCDFLSREASRAIYAPGSDAPRR